MSSVAPPSTPGIYRLVSTQLTTGAKHGSLSDNVTFNTNIPSLNFALRIWRVRWMMGFSAIGASGGAIADVQLFAQLTENQTKTSVNVTDTSYLDQAVQHYVIDFETAAGFLYDPVPFEVIHDFAPHTTPLTVATKLNMVASMLENTGNLNGSTVFKPICTIEYTLEQLTPDLRDYLAKRLQIQGS